MKAHISFAKIDFKCPFCEMEYEDDDEKLLDRCNKNKSGITSVKCKCGSKFGFTYDITGQAVGFMLNDQDSEPYRKLKPKPTYYSQQVYTKMELEKLAQTITGLVEHYQGYRIDYAKSAKKATVIFYIEGKELKCNHINYKE